MQKRLSFVHTSAKILLETLPVIHCGPAALDKARLAVPLC